MEGGIEGEKKKKKRKLGPDGEIIVKKRGWVIKWFLIKKNETLISQFNESLWMQWCLLTEMYSVNLCGMILCRLYISMG